MAGSSLALTPPTTSNRRAVVLTGLTLLVVAIGLLWAKWLPYADRISVLAVGTLLVLPTAGEVPILPGLPPPE